jgi:hypothetical protein
MRKGHSFYLETSTVEAAQQYAKDAGVSVSNLIEHFMERGLAIAPDEIRKTLVRSQGVGFIPAKERKCLEAFTHMRAAEPSVDGFDTADIADHANLWPSEAYRALRFLQSKGLMVPLDVETGKVDRVGRPIVFWTTPAIKAARDARKGNAAPAL